TRREVAAPPPASGRGPRSESSSSHFVGDEGGKPHVPTQDLDGGAFGAGPCIRGPGPNPASADGDRYFAAELGPGAPVQWLPSANRPRSERHALRRRLRG